MKHLIDHRLMFGNMILVESPVWVERYKKALASLTGRTTALTEFYIDISGYSPEIAHELGNEDYLKPKNGHRQFIILTSQQASSPMLKGEFSFLREGLKAFIRNNEAAVTTITAFDVLVGDIDDSAWRVKSAADLDKVRSVRFSAGSLNGGCKDSSKMKDMADRFINEPDAWADDLLVSDMVQLAKKGGDLVRNPVQIEDLTLRTENYYADLFGGVYVIRSSNPRMMIFRDPAVRRATEINGYAVHDLYSGAWLYDALSREGLTEPLTQLGNVALPTVQRKRDYALLAALCDHAPQEITELDSRSLRFAFGRADINTSPVLSSLTEVCKDLEMDAYIEVPKTSHKVWPYLHRAVHGPAEHVVNAVLAENSQDDPAALFALNKPAFLKKYVHWAEARRVHFSQRIAQDYLLRKPQFREETFGHAVLIKNPID